MPAARRERGGGHNGTQQQQQQNRRRDGDAGTAAWAPVHRYALMQHLMRVGCMRKDAALQMFEQLTGLGDEESFNAMVAEQNVGMRQLGLEVRLLRHPVDKQAYVAFVNKLDDTASKVATHYKHGQREFFKHVLAAIAADPAAVEGVGTASSIQLLNMDVSQPVGGWPEPPQGGGGDGGDAAAAAGGDAAMAAAAAGVAEARKLTKADKEATLNQLAQEGWLQHSPTRSGHFCIGPRAFMELSEFLLTLDMPPGTQEAWMEIL